ncbi:cell division protein DivIC [Parelusimicrobium proximum]|uniref:FtsB family cell division protein n=1 Tax=Parelusimicrobium proximum TaxID=3228953 RepID=UPI003D171261
MRDIIFNVASKMKPQYIIIMGMAAFIFFDGSLLGLIHNKRELRKLKLRNEQLDKEYADLSAQLERLEKGDPAYIEEIARVKYHLIKNGETEFRFKQ